MHNVEVYWLDRTSINSRNKKREQSRGPVIPEVLNESPILNCQCNGYHISQSTHTLFLVTNVYVVL